MLFFHLFTVCSARVGASVIMLSDSPRRKMEDLSDCVIAQIVGAHLAGASVIKTATLLGASRATVSKVMSAYTNRGKTTSAKRNSGRNSTLTERDRRTLRRIVSKNHTTTAAQVTGQQN
jgi:transposase